MMIDRFRLSSATLTLVGSTLLARTAATMADATCTASTITTTTIIAALPNSTATSTGVLLRRSAGIVSLIVAITVAARGAMSEKVLA